MTKTVKPAVRSDNLDRSLSKADLKALLWPILKRVPRYVRLGWALLKEPTIAHRHKALLYTTIVYTFSPLHLLAGPIPVVAQLDSVLLLLLGIRQALAHCPAEVRERHLDRLKIPPRQAGKDLNVGMYLAIHTLGEIGRPVGQKALFASRVARGFSSRLLGRLGREAKQAKDENKNVKKDEKNTVKSRKVKA